MPLSTKTFRKCQLKQQLTLNRYVAYKRLDINMIPHGAHERLCRRCLRRWLSLPRTTHNPPQCVNKHQRALWVEDVLPEPMALFNLIPLPVTTVSPPQTPWQPHLHKSACLPVPLKARLTDC